MLGVLFGLVLFPGLGALSIAVQANTRDLAVIRDNVDELRQDRAAASTERKRILEAVIRLEEQLKK